jgi:hypothetical protein
LARCHECGEIILFEDTNTDKGVVQKLDDRKEIINQVTLTTAPSLESKKYNELHIDSIFSKQQIGLWTCDNESNSYYWYVNFEFGYCFLNRAIEDQCFVRLVRIGDN